MSMTGVCVGLGFVVNPDGSLGLNGPRSLAWPYSCAIGTANGLRVDTVAGNLWAEPPDLHTVATSSATNASYTATSSYSDAGIGSITLNNPDACRPTLVFGELRCTFPAPAVLPGNGLTINGDVYATTGPSPGSQPVRFYRAVPSTASGGLQITQTITIPWQYTMTAGQTGQVMVGSFAVKTDGANVAIPSISYTWSYEYMTARASW